MSKIEQNKEKKRLAILQAAHEIFISEGYELSSMDKIAKQAGMTKQTVYRYFSSKIELFQATLKQVGENLGGDFSTAFEIEDNRKALERFAEDFIEFHLTDEHIAMFRLLIAESPKFPEILESFKTVGPNKTMDQLQFFFKDQLTISEPNTHIKLWVGMLHSLRGGVLMGMEKPNKQQIKNHAKSATDMLLLSLK